MITKLVHHGFNPPRCIIDDGLECIDSIRNAPGMKWYLRGDFPPHYPVPAIEHVEFFGCAAICLVRWSQYLGGTCIMKIFARNAGY